MSKISIRVMYAWNLNKIFWEWRKLSDGKTAKQTDRQTVNIKGLLPNVFCRALINCSFVYLSLQICRFHFGLTGTPFQTVILFLQVVFYTLCSCPILPLFIEIFLKYQQLVSQYTDLIFQVRNCFLWSRADWSFLCSDCCSAWTLLLKYRNMVGQSICSFFTKPQQFRLDQTQTSCKWQFNSLPNDKILDVTKLKAFADDKINVAQMMIFVLDKLKNIVGKGQNGGHQHFLLFPQYFKLLSH